MTKTLQYIDGIDQVKLIDGVVRMDLIGIRQIVDGKADIESAGALAMSIQGFLRMHEQMTRVANKLVEQGILKKNSAAVDPTSTDLNDAAAPGVAAPKPRRK